MYVCSCISMFTFGDKGVFLW